MSNTTSTLSAKNFPYFFTFGVAPRSRAKKVSKKSPALSIIDLPFRCSFRKIEKLLPALTLGLRKQYFLLSSNSSNFLLNFKSRVPSQLYKALERSFNPTKSNFVSYSFHYIFAESFNKIGILSL